MHRGSAPDCLSSQPSGGLLIQPQGIESKSWGGYIFLLLSGASFLWLWNFGLWDLEGADEGRYVQVAKELQERSNWLLLTVRGEAYDQKPPLPFWMIAAALKLSGGEVSAWSTRLPSVLLGILSVLLVFDIGRVRWNARAGFVSGLVLMTAPLFARQTPTARLDVLFTGWIVVAAWAWLAAPTEQMSTRLSRGRAVVFWLGLTAAFFTKGPLALIAMFGMLLGESWRSRSWKPWRSVYPLAGGSVLLALIGLWLWSQRSLVGEEFVQGQLLTGTIERLREGAHANPLWYYVATLFEDVFYPWLFFLLPATVALWRKRKEGLPEGIRPTLFWIASVALVLHLASGKRTQYLLPILPAMALITGWFIEFYFLQRPLRAWAYRTTLILTGLVSVGLLGVGIAGKLMRERLWAMEFYTVDFHTLIIACLLIIVAGTGIALARKRSAWAVVLTLGVLTMSVEVFYAGVVNTARNDRRSSRSFSTIVERLRPSGEHAIGAVGRADRSKYHVYGDYAVIPIDLEGKPLESENDFPRIIVAREQDDEEVDEVEDSGNYEYLCSAPADGDALFVYRKIRKPSGGDAEQETLRFAMLGDTGVAGNEQAPVVERILDLHAQAPLDAIMLLGDNLYGDDPFDYGMRRRFIVPFAPLIGRQIPFYAVIGNHDNHPPEKLEGELNSPLFNMKGRTYYKETFGRNLVTFFMLNSETLADEPEQLNWLRAELAACLSEWKILVLHRPLQASQLAHGPKDGLYEILEPVITGPQGVDLVFAGHNHLFERRKPVKGVTHITLGAGGKLESDEPFPPDPNRAAGYIDGRSFGWIEVSPSSVQFTAVSETGAQLDRFEIIKPAAPPANLARSGSEGPSFANNKDSSSGLTVLP